MRAALHVVFEIIGPAVKAAHRLAVDGAWIELVIQRGIEDAAQLRRQAQFR